MVFKCDSTRALTQYEDGNGYSIHMCKEHVITTESIIFEGANIHVGQLSLLHGGEGGERPETYP